MPVPAFGFSAGDLVSAIGLVKKICKALKRTGGASTEYQHAINELEGLENVLRHLESLEPNQDNERHINAVRGMALACQLPLRDFLAKMEKYEASLGPFSSPQWFRGLPQKSKWAVAFAEEVEKTRALVAAKTVSISLLLAMDHSKSLYKMEANLGKRREREHSELLSKVAEHRSTLDSLGERITNIKDRIQQAAQTSDEKLEALSSDVEATKAAVMSFRGVKQQITSFFSAFPLEMRDLLQKILQSNGQIYHILLSIQQSPTQSPTQSLDSNIQFEDAMGELIPLPYVYFRHWETFEGFLRSHFKGIIGEVKVEEGQYNILNVDKGRATVKKDHWTRSIDQGARLSMSMIMSRLRRAMGQCPRPSCTGSRFVQYHVRTNLLTCELCNLKFYAEAGELEDTFGHVTVQDPEEQVAQKQVEEDLRIYGTRHKPSDAVDLGEDEKMSKLPPKRSASEFEASVDRPAKARKKSECQTFNYEKVTAMDWNAGESPMMAWVNQSAVPAAIPTDTSKPDPSVSKDEELLQQEKQEIEIFKNVHVIDALVPANSAKFAAGHEYGLDLDFGAQIYYRNIVDRYPLLPPYLARRLAIANHNRAERLHNSRLRNSRAMEVPGSPPSSNGPRLESQSDAVHQNVYPRRMSSERMTPYLPQSEPRLESQSDAAYYNVYPRRMSSERMTPYLPQYEPRLESQSDVLYQNVYPRRRSSEHLPQYELRLESQSDVLYQNVYPRRRSSEHLPQFEPRLESQSDAVHQNVHHRRMSSDRIPLSSPQYVAFEHSHITPYFPAHALPWPSSKWEEFERPYYEAEQARLEAEQARLEAEQARLEAEQACLFERPYWEAEQARFKSEQACIEADSVGNGILINGERYACEACFDNNRVSSCYHTDRHLLSINNNGRWTHIAPSPSNRGEAPSPKPEQDFWTGRRQSHRPSSVQSYGSSRNSSLHGVRAMDPSYQNPDFSKEDQKLGSTEADNSSRGLFPAPIDWTATQSGDQVSKGISFECEICGEVVWASRRLDWQNHAMNDLRPYACTAEDCSQPDETYSTVKDYLRHEILFHEVPNPVDDFATRAGKSITCLFCGQQTTEGRGPHSRGRHLGQHMEEIAFTVVPKAYEDWEFYSEASSGK